MKKKTLHIKNMVCNRCIKVVREEMEKLNYNVYEIELGEVILTSDKDNFNMDRIRTALENNGFELIGSRNANIIERVKILIINLIHNNSFNNFSEINLREEIGKETGLSYQYVSTLFSSMQGITIEKYIIHQKIEKVKELLVYAELTLSEIAYSLGYSSVQHLSNQFKKITGLSPGYFKKLKSKKRKSLDKII